MRISPLRFRERPSSPLRFDRAVARLLGRLLGGLVVTVVAGALFGAARPALAQDDACDPRCDGDVLRFCDGETPVALACAELPAEAGGPGRCALLSEAWGDDCVLPGGATCAPGYAFGASRCDPDASLACIDGVCTVTEDGVTPSPAPAEPTPGTFTPISARSENLGCLGCAGDPSAALLLGILGLRRLRRGDRRR